MASKLKKEYEGSTTIDLYFPKIRKSYSVTKEKLCEMADNGTLDKRYHSMFVKGSIPNTENNEDVWEEPKALEQSKTKPKTKSKAKVDDKEQDKV